MAKKKGRAMAGQVKSLSSKNGGKPGGVKTLFGARVVSGGKGR
jgi:hypothetical protein